MSSNKPIKVEVAYATLDKQLICELQLTEAMSLYDVAVASKIDTEFANLNLTTSSIGIFGKIIPDPKAQMAKDGDRIEIYRPLTVDPKESRRIRAEQAKKKKHQNKPS